MQQKIVTININSGNVNWIPVPGDPKQNYLPRMQWISSNELIIQQLNRHQNHLKLWRHSLETGNITEFYSEKDEAWVDILNMDASAPWTMSDLEHGDNALFRLTEKRRLASFVQIAVGRVTGEVINRR